MRLRRFTGRVGAIARYLITFPCYGARLHGDDRGSVDRLHNVPGSRTLEPQPALVEAMRVSLLDQEYLLDASRRVVVLTALREVCAFRGWALLAAHVRTTHVHVVVEAGVAPEKVMNDLKAYASRRLNEVEGERKRWARHGSTRWLKTDDDVRSAIRYVVEEQGDKMEWFDGWED